MPTEITRPPTPIGKRSATVGRNSRDVTPTSLIALAVTAILVVVLHVAGSAMLDRSQAHAPMAAMDHEAKCLEDAPPPARSLPFD